MKLQKRGILFISFLFLASLVFTPPLWSLTLIIDNGGSGFTTVGDWPSSRLVPGYYGTNYQWTYSGDGSSRATWTFSLPVAGEYTVCAWWSSPYSTRASDAPFTITHASGSTRIEVDQRVNGSQWNLLGTFSFNTGNARVVLASDADGNPVADAVRFESVSTLNADFSATPTTGVTPLQVQFTDLSQGEITSWLWDFGDGHTSSAQHPLHTYESPGSVSVTLTVGNATDTDIETKEHYLTIYNPSAIELIIDNEDIGFTTEGEWPFSTLVPGYYGTNYQWTYSGNGSSRATWTFTIPVEGDYTVSAWWSSPYSTRASDAPFTITHASGSTSIEVDQRVNGGQWNDLGTFHFTPGNATVVLSSESDGNPVADAVRLNFATSTLLNAEFSATPTTGTAPLQVQFTDLSQGEITSWLWNFGDGYSSTQPSPLHLYQNAGTYSVSLTVTGTGGADDTETKTAYITVSAAPVPPTANFSATPTTGAAPLTVRFTDTSTGDITSWFWNFGDGNTSTLEHPVHQYLAESSYTVQLTVSGNGYEDTHTKLNYISVTGDPTAYQFIWPIEEQDFFILQSFGNQRLEQPGLYHSATDFCVYRSGVEVHAIANGWVEHFDGFGNALMMRHLLPSGEYVHSWYNHLAYSPQGNFSIGEFIPIGTVIGIAGETGWTPSGLHLHFEIKHTNDGSGGYVADLGNHFNPYEFIYSRLAYNQSPPDQCLDGTFVDHCSVTMPLHCITGGYLVQNSLHCGCATGVPQTDATCSKTEGGIIIDNDDPECTITGFWEQSTLVMGFYGQDFLTSYATSPLSEARYTPSLPQSGYYEVDGWWRDKLSFIDPTTRATNTPITINHCGGSTTIFADQTDFHKGWKSLGTYYFNQGSSHRIIIANNANGTVVADAIRLVYQGTSGLPQANFSASPVSGYTPLAVQFADLSCGVVSTWLWNFGDGHTSTVQNPVYLYENAGTYTVSLTVENASGTDTETKTNYITVSAITIPPPTANFSATPTAGVAPLTVQFNDLSQGEISSRLWDFGDGNSSTQPSPLHLYQNAGTYTVSLTVGNSSGTDTETKTNYITVTDPGSTPELTNGVAVAGALVSGEEVHYWIAVPGGQDLLEVSLTGTRDADLYVRYGAPPTVSRYDCRPYTGTSNEVCSFSYPAEGIWYIMVRGYSATSTYQLVAHFSASTATSLTNGTPATGTVSADENVFYKIGVPSGQQRLEIKLTGTGGDADLYVNYGSFPTLSEYDCRPYKSSSNELCTFSSPTGGEWFIMINGYSGTVTYQIVATYY